jgi:hypothetical protein
MLPCYKRHKSSNKRTQRDFKQQKYNQTLGKKLKGLEENEEEPKKYNPSREQDEYEISQSTIAMETRNKKVKQCSNK